MSKCGELCWKPSAESWGRQPCWIWNELICQFFALIDRSRQWWLNMLIYRRNWLIPCDFIVMCYCNASVPWCIVVMHHHRDALWCIITVMYHRYDVSTWCIQSVIRNWLYVTFYWYGACMMCCDTVWWMLMHGCWWMNDECWCMNVDEWMMSVDAWMLMNEWWMWMNE